MTDSKVIANQIENELQRIGISMIDHAWLGFTVDPVGEFVKIYNEKESILCDGEKLLSHLKAIDYLGMFVEYTDRLMSMFGKFKV